MRHSFGTLLSTAGVAPRTAQAAMRHSTINLTMNTYTDPKLLDVHGALDALPALPLKSDGQSASQLNVERATGADGSPIRKLAPDLAPTPDNSCKSMTTPGKMEGSPSQPHGPAVIPLTGCYDKERTPLTTPVIGVPSVETSGLEPPTPGLQSRVSLIAKKLQSPLRDKRLPRFNAFCKPLQTCAFRRKQW